MNIGGSTIETMNRPVIRVRIMGKAGNAKLKYFTSVSSAARYLAWQQVYATHRVFMPEYTVGEIACTCERNYWSGVQTDNSDCDLHNHKDGFYVREMRRIKAEILAAWNDEQPGGES